MQTKGREPEHGDTETQEDPLKKELSTALLHVLAGDSRCGVGRRAGDQGGFPSGDI